MTIAHILRARGIRGEVAAIALTSRPERFSDLKLVTLFSPAGAAEHEIESVWQHGERWIFKFRGIDSMTDAEKLANSEIRIPKTERPPAPEGEYYYSDLLGCEVIDRSTGESLGPVTDWQEYSGTGLLEVGKLMIPFARSICVVIDVPGRRIEVDLPEGLKDLER